MSVRNLLQRSAERLRELQKQPPPPTKPPQIRIEELFNTQVNLVKSKEALQSYSQDALMWFTQDLANGVNGISVETVKPNKWFSTKWNDESIHFAFEGGDSAPRWKVIANEAINVAEKGAKKLIVFRTPDLKQVPKPGWKAIGPILDKAVTLGLDIHSLDLASVCEIHAARDLYSDALQGNVDLCSITSPTGPKPPTKIVKPKAKVAGALSPKQKTEILQFIELKRFVSANDVIQQLKLSVSVEILLKEIQGAPIKTFPGPDTVVIQWRNLPSP